MSDVSRGRVPFEAGGAPRYLHFSLNAFCAYQEKFDGDIMDAFNGMNSGGTDFILMRRLFWVGLSHENLTEIEAGDVVGDLDLMAAMELLTKAIGAAMPDPDETDPQGKPDAAAKPRKAKPKG